MADRAAFPFSSPFIEIDGIPNVREVGPAFSRSPSVFIRPRVVFRGGDPSRITPRGKIQLNDLGIKAVVDLRDDLDPGATLPLDGVEWIHVKGEGKAPVDPVKTAAKMKAYETDTVKAFVEAYGSVLDEGGAVFELAFKFLRDNPLKPVLIQCSAGKNRTGITIALLLSLLGVNDQDIIDDYALSSIGLEPALPGLIEKFEMRNQAYKDNPIGLRNFLSAKAESMAGTLALIRERFGGAENYLLTHAKLTQEDLGKIRTNLLVGGAGDKDALTL